MKCPDNFGYLIVYGAVTDCNLFNKDFFIDYSMTVGWNTLAMPNTSEADTGPLRNPD